MPTGDRQPELSLRGRSVGSADDTRSDIIRREEDGMHHGNQTSIPPARGSYQPRPSRGPSIRRVGSRELMGASGQLIIRHAGDEYHLRVTSKGKLILTK